MSGTGRVERVELSELPATGPLYRRAALGLLPGLGRAGAPAGFPDDAGELPRTEVALSGATVDREHLARYVRVCGFRLGNALPPTYPHVLAFPLSLHLMTAPGFPFPLIGLVHVANRITIDRPIDTGERLHLSVRATGLRPHPRGRQVDIVTTASVGDETVWRGVATYLRRESRPTSRALERGTPAPTTPPTTPTVRWRVDPTVAREYARVSGDRNPIHTSRLTARLLGFPRTIAHGMWSKARCLAALQGRLPDSYTVEVAFKLPITLPAALAFSAVAPTADAGLAWRFNLFDPRDGRPHLAGTLA